MSSSALRPAFLTRFTLGAVALGALALASACAGGVTPSRDPAPNPTGTPRSTPAGPTPLVDAAWPVRTREHVDLWLHSYALLTRDTTLVPYFRRGYAERLTTLLDGFEVQLARAQKQTD